jgi:hypothetical protein
MKDALAHVQGVDAAAYLRLMRQAFRGVLARAFKRQLVCIGYPRERFRSGDTRYICLLYRNSKPKRAKLNNQINQINHFKQRILKYGSHSQITTTHIALNMITPQFQTTNS